MKIYKITAINTASSINFVNFKLSMGGQLLTYTSFELFYQVSDLQYIGVFQNGVVAFVNYSQAEIANVLAAIRPYMIDPQENLSETVELLLTDTKKVYSETNILYIPMEYDSKELLRLVMNDLVQILGVVFYSKITENLLSEVKVIANKLAQTGKIALGKKERNKFIGSCLSTKNRIADNLYIFDAPNLVWDDENLERVHKVITSLFNLEARLKEVEYTLEVINDNLQIFMEIFEHTRASTLELIVIWLIVFEIVNSLLERFHI